MRRRRRGLGTTAGAAGTPLERLDALQERGLGIVGGGEQHPGAHDLEEQAGRSGAAHLRERGVRHLGAPRQGGETELRGLPAHRLEHVDGYVDETAVGRVGDRVQQNQITQALEQVRGEAARVVPRLHHLLDGAEQGGAVGARERVDGRVDERRIGDTEQAECALIRHALRTGTGEQLIHDRQRVTRGAAAGADHQGVHLRLDRDVLGTRDPLQQRPHHVRREQPEGVVVRARADGGEHLLRLRGGEDEDQVLRRLLHDLQ
ncbi:hypothetical protein MTP03_45290 [Tsukamurella sp. PLM1]|nr:hypothetical protein MTP03_45290 [Tsukamurella sp. PLM1]